MHYKSTKKLNENVVAGVLKRSHDVCMILNHNYTTLKRANEIEIPDIYFNRLKTGIERIDNMFGEGILPGSTFTVDAAPGVGKCHGPDELIEVHGSDELISMIEKFIHNSR